MPVLANSRRVAVLTTLAVSLYTSVARAADTTPPSLTGIAVSPNPVAAGNTVTISLTSVDAGSGVDTNKIIAILLNPQGSGQVTVTNSWSLTGPNAYSGTANIPTYAVTGTWSVYSVFLYDRAGNGKAYRNGRDYTKTFSVTGAQPDGAPPELLGLQGSPSQVILGSPFTVTIDIRDTVSGVDLSNLFVNLIPENGTAGYTRQVRQWTSLGGDRYQGQVTIPGGDPTGPWYVHSVFTRDLAGNEIHYFPGALFNVSFTVSEPIAPSIYQHPLNVNAAIGGTPSFSVGADGTPPLTYQWLRNGSVITGATSSNYTTPTITALNDDDTYRCIVSNAYGSAISDAAAIRIGPSDLQTILSGQTPDYWYRLDNTITNSGLRTAPALERRGGLFTADARNYAERAFMFNDGEESLAQPQDILASTGSMTLLIRAPDSEITGFRHVFAQGTETTTSNAFNLVFSKPNLKLKLGNASFDLIGSQPTPGGWYYLAFTWDEGRDAGEVQWWFGPVGGSLASGQVDLNDGAVIGDGSALILGSNERSSFGNFRENHYPGAIDEPAIWSRELNQTEVFQQFAAITAPVGAPFFITQPLSAGTIDGAYAHFNIDVLGDAPLSFQWQRNGADLPGATGAVLSLGPVSIAGDDGAEFRCIAANPLGAATSVTATLTVSAPRDFQQTLSAQAPDYWFTTDQTLANSGSQFAPSLIGSGGAFTNDNLDQSAAAYALVSGQAYLLQTKDIIPSAGSLTILFRAPATPITGFRHVFGQGAETGPSNAWNLSFANPNLQLKAGNASVTLITGQPQSGAWYFFNARWDESRDAGELKWTFASIGGSLTSGTLDLGDTAVVGTGGALFFGNKDTGFGALREINFPGAVDEIAVWNRELSDGEVVDQFITTTGPIGLPFFLQQPQNGSGKDGEIVTFSVQVTGQVPIQYQWRVDGGNIPGAISTNLPFGPVTTNDNGRLIDVVVSNAFGTVTSQVASLSVTPLNSFQAIVQGHAPDYWFRLDNSLVNRGSLSAPDLAAGGGAFADDIGDNPSSAFNITAANGYLYQVNDLIASTGSVSFLFRTPNDPLSGFRHLFAQGVDTATSNSFNILYNNPNLMLRMGSRTATLLTGVPTPATWYYFAAHWDDTRDAGEATWYFGAVGDVLTSGTIDLGNSDFVGNDGAVALGNRDNVAGAAWRMPSQPGTVDELAVWGRELSPAEIAAQFQEAFPSVTSLAASNLIFRSSGTNAPGGGWTLQENGFAGCFLNVLGSTSGTRTITLSATLNGIADAGVFPQARLSVGGASARFDVNSNGLYQHTFTLPEGMHAVRVELTNAPYGSARALSISNLALSGSGATLVNMADDATCLAAAETFIEHWRKGDIQITVIDSLGATQANAQVEVQLARHAFRFGAATAGLRSTQDAPPESQLNWLSGATSDGDNYRTFVSNHFHAVGFKNAAKWNPHEQTRDVQTMTLTDQLLGFAQTNGMAVRIHAVGWANDTFAPDWAYTLYTNALAGSASDAAAFRDELSERIQYLVRDRAHRYDEVDVVNEDYHKPGYTTLYGTNGLAGLYLEAKTNAVAAGNRAGTYVNEFNVLRYEIENGSYLQSYANWYRRHIEGLDKAAGQVVVDGIGIQGHVNTDAGARSLTPYSIRRNVQTLLHLGVLGKPISITEFDITDDDGSGGPISDAEATNILMSAMTTCFGSPGVTTFMMWDFWESSMDIEKAGSALVDASWNLTAAGIAYTNRMAEWTTRESGLTDAAGSFAFRGYHGDYIATVTAPGGNPTSIVFRLAANASATSIVLIANGGAPSSNTYAQVIQGLNPDYWYRFGGNLSNSGTKPASNMTAVGGAYGPDYDATASRAYQMVGGNDFLAASNDLIKGTGSFSMLLRTPDAVLGFRHIFAQGDDPALGNAFNLIHSNPNINFRVGNASATLLAGVPPTGVWYYIAATWDDTRDAGEVRWWFGPAGGALSSGTLDIGNANTIGNNGAIYLGNRGPGFAVAFRMPGAPGTLDEFAVWETELSVSDISNQFAALSVGIGGGMPAPPTQAAPPFHIVGMDPELAATTPGLLVMFESIVGQTYRIDWCDDLATGSWQTAAVITAAGPITSWQDQGDDSSGRPHPFAIQTTRFYHVRKVE